MTQKRDRQYEDDGERKSNRKLKHAMNQKGKGMKVLNSYVEEYYSEEDLDYEFDIDDEDENTNTH
jgi:uncharacterized protein YpmS